MTGREDVGYRDKNHIAEQSDGSTEQHLNTLGRVEERIETKISDKDGVTEDHISYIPMKAKRYTFTNPKGQRYLDNFEVIDWSE